MYYYMEDSVAEQLHDTIANVRLDDFTVDTSLAPEPSIII